MATGVNSEPIFVLIHGSWHGAWCWERLLPLLRGRALALNLPGRWSHGPQGLGAITLADWIDAVVAAGQALGERELVLVGHSMGALTLPGAAVRLAQRVRHVVYLAGIAPDEGRCAADMFMPWLPLSLGPFSSAPPGGTLPPRPAARWMLCNDLDQATATWLLERLLPTPTRPAITRVSWQGLRWPCPVTYIQTTRDKAVAPRVQQRCLRNLPGARILPIKSGHELMLSRPAELAEMLLAAT